jgi:ESCRT-I complex subunit VPS28
MTPAGELRLCEDATERRNYDALADLFSIIKAVEHLERAYVRDAVSSEAYTEACQRLIAQFKTTEAAIKSNPLFKGTAEFITEYKLDCPLAKERLLVSGVPATVMFAHSDKMGAASVVLATEATQGFITAMDVLKLDQRAVDEVQPYISDLVKVLNKCETITPGFDKSKLQRWLVELNAMRASQELDDDQMRQLIMDLESSYGNFKQSLQGL